MSSGLALTRLVLASASPRRRALLEAAGLSFEVDPPNIDERRRAGEAPETFVRRMAVEKAQATATRHPDCTVIAADTIVVIDDDVLGKPADAADARGMLGRLSGRGHIVLTAVAVSARGALRSEVERTTVWMRPLAAGEIEAYVATGEPLDKAGAYGVQGGAARFVERVDGALDTVVGLPVSVVLSLLKTALPAR